MRRSLSLTTCACVLTLMATACTRVPELEDQLTPDLKSADYPDLIPLEQALAPLPLPETQSAELEQQLLSRSASLQQRARALQSISN
ncbi:hypothetical protein DL239_01460 [Sedimentitalea sp. CY04]|uniref:DUF3035 domain-containing protein n=1 Tax=Parasedimentitalea denitrificans TaxID=2211118 RepID=A0ABX0W4S3_9RHOB|nr:hypothetical protein [Sedimentitalea sp. CY04]NIZ59637.1 hypothetical protein [Sedimentitalea sp. CY04]